MKNELNLYGEITVYQYTKDWIEKNGILTKEGVLINIDDKHKMKETHNTIGSALKTRLRDCITSDTGSTVGYMGENGFFTTNTYGSSEDGHDGIVLLDETNLTYHTLITTAHPIDPSGSYYKKFRGQITFTVASYYTAPILGIDWTSSATGGATGAFAYEFATGTVALTPAVGDIFVIDWKISIS